jgi:hypothetical protein
MWFLPKRLGDTCPWLGMHVGGCLGLTYRNRGAGTLPVRASGAAPPVAWIS